MSQNKIMRCLDKANGRFLTELDEGEKEEAVQEFRRLWSEQKQKVKSIINRNQKTHFNLETQEKELTAQAKQLALDLQNRMSKNAKKRSVLQLQKLKSYRHMDRVWKQRVTQITMNLKKQQKKKYEKSQQLSKQIEQFWENKKSSSSSPRRSSKQFRELSPKESRKYPPSHNFMTEANTKIRKIEERRKARSVVEDEQIHGLREKVQERVPASRSLNIHRKKANSIDPYLIKWNSEVKKSQDAVFQKAMKKIDIILKRRIQTRQALLEHSRQAKESLELKKNMYFNKERKFKSERGSHSLHEQHHKLNLQNVEQRRSTVLMPYHNLKMDQRRREIEEENFRLRTEIMGQERLKEKKGKFHRMVRDAVKLCRFQTLKGKL